MVPAADLSERVARQVDLIGLRGGFGTVLEALPDELGSELKIITPDTLNSGGLARLYAERPNQFLNIGISEQAAVLIGGGLYPEWRAVVATFAPFLVLRACEQIKLVSSYMKLPLIYVGYAGGIDLIDLGHTHCSIEDIGLMQSLGITCYTPSTARGLWYSLVRAASTNEPSYIRLSSNGKIPSDLSTVPIDTKIGGSLIPCCSSDGGRFKTKTILLSYGSLSIEAYRAAQDLGLDFLCISRIDKQNIKNLLMFMQSRGYKAVYVVEDHVRQTGLCSALAQQTNELNIVSLGLLDGAEISGRYGDVIQALGLDAKALSAEIIRRGS